MSKFVELNPVEVMPYAGNVPLNGPDAPPIHSISEMIRYLVTIQHRFGDTCVATNIRWQWGSNALWMRDALSVALEESVKLQSHYAGLLNQYDGGQRKQFADANEWLVRLRETMQANGAKTENPYLQPESK